MLHVMFCHQSQVFCPSVTSVFIPEIFSVVLQQSYCTDYKTWYGIGTLVWNRHIQRMEHLMLIARYIFCFGYFLGKRVQAILSIICVPPFSVGVSL